MANSEKWIFFFLLFAICCFFILYCVDAIWSSSVDLAHHYALAYRISEQWILSSINDPTLGEMNYYPRGSHIIAAIIGHIFNSTILGIQVTALSSFAVLWLCLFLILKSLEKKTAFLSLLFFSFLIVMNFNYTRLSIHGDEIIGNYFFSQLVGNAVVFAVMLIAIHIEKNRGLGYSLAFLVPVTVLSAYIHLLPSIQMLGLICGLLLLFLMSQNEGPLGIKKKLPLSILISISSIVGVLLHPSFVAMGKISKNNGALSLDNLNYPYGLMSLNFALLVLSFILLAVYLNCDNKKNIALKYIAIYGATVSLLCVMQYVLGRFGYGSEYAVKKYVFGITTIIILELSILFALILSKHNIVSSVLSLCSDKITSVTVFISFFIVAAVLVPGQKVLDVSEMASLERGIEALADTVIPFSGGEDNNVIMNLNGFPSTINYLFSISILKTPRELAIQDVLLNQSISDFSGYYSHVITSPDSYDLDTLGCESTQIGRFLLLPSACLDQLAVQLSDCRSFFDFSSNGNIPNYLYKGFSFAEEHGRWTEGKSANFKCFNYGPPLSRIKIELSPFIFSKVEKQRLSIKVNDLFVGEYRLRHPRLLDNPLVVDLPPGIRSDKYTIDFQIPDAITPKEVFLNEDTREIGFSFKSIEFE